MHEQMLEGAIDDWKMEPGCPSWTGIALTSFTNSDVSCRVGQELHQYYNTESIAVDSNNSNLVYIAVGDYVASYGTAGAILRSDDAGVSWSVISPSSFVKCGGNSEYRDGGEKMQLHPLRAGTLVFGARDGSLWLTTNDGQDWSQPVNFSTLQGCTPDQGLGIQLLSWWCPTRSESDCTLVAAVAGCGVYWSSGDYSSWHLVQGSPTTVMRLQIAQRDSKTVVWMSTRDAGLVRGTSTVSSLQATDWEIRSFQPAENGTSYCGIHVSKDASLWAAPYNTSGRPISILYSGDLGASWSTLSMEHRTLVPWMSGQYLDNEATAALAFDPVEKEMFLSDWYGVWVSNDLTNATTNSTTHWTNPISGIEEVVVFDLKSPPVGPKLLTGCADVCGFVHSDSDEQYTPLRIGSEQHTMSIDFTTNSSQHLTIVKTCAQGWEVYSQVACSFDNGQTFEDTTWNGHYPGHTALRVALSANHPENFVVVAAGLPLMYTLDGGKSWGASNTSFFPVRNWFWWPQPLASSQSTPGTFHFYNESTGILYTSQDGGKTFASNKGDPLPRSSWYMVKTAPLRSPGSGHVWVAPNSSGLWLSKDSGSSFEQIQGVTALLVATGPPLHQGGNYTVFALGTRPGQDRLRMMFSSTLGATWQSMDDPNVAMGDLPYSMTASMSEPGKVYVGTGGRGVYVGEIVKNRDIHKGELTVNVSIVGPAVTVWNSSWTNCSADGLGPDNMDTPARAFVDLQGTVHLTSSCSTSRLMSGPSLFEVKHNCSVVLNSTHDVNPSQYADYEWIHAPYVVEGTHGAKDRIFGLLHNEYHGFMHNNCKDAPFRKGHCQMFSLSAAESLDGGWSWQHVAPPPHHLIAAVPYKYVDNSSQLWFGWGDSGGIVRSPIDDYYYTTGHNRASIGQQANGTCLMRTQTPFDVSSWRGWNGASFDTTFTNPYFQDTVNGSVCMVLEDVDGGLPRGSRAEGLVHQGLVWSTYLNAFVGVFWNPSFDPKLINGNPLGFATSKNLLQWDSVLPLPLPPSPDQHLYPALLDPSAATSGNRNFDVIGQFPWLFYTQATPRGTGPKAHWESLQRLPLKFE